MRQRRTTARVAIGAGAVPVALAVTALAASSGGAQTPAGRTISVVEHNEIVHVDDVAPKIGSIVGGTGAYDGARGTVLSVKRTEKGKEVFDDTLTLLP